MNIVEIREQLERTAERIEKAEKVVSDYRQSYEVMLWSSAAREVRLKVENRYRVNNLGLKPIEVTTGMDIEEADKPVFEACIVTPGNVNGPGSEIIKPGSDLLVPCPRVGVVRAKGPEYWLPPNPDEFVDVIWRYSIQGPVTGRDCISFGAVTVGPIIIRAEHHNDFEFGLESRNPYLDMKMVNPEWRCETMLIEQHVNFTWRLKAGDKSGADI